MLTLTKHFCEQWMNRVGPDVPGPVDVKKMIERSVMLQRQRDLFTPRGRRHRVLALYWFPAANVVFKLDDKSGTVVTVLSPRTVESRESRVESAVEEIGA